VEGNVLVLIVAEGEVDGHRGCAICDEVFDVAVAPGALAIERYAQCLKDGGLAGAGFAEDADQRPVVEGQWTERVVAAQPGER